MTKIPDPLAARTIALLEQIGGGPKGYNEFFDARAILKDWREFAEPGARDPIDRIANVAMLALIMAPYLYLWRTFA